MFLEATGEVYAGSSGQFKSWERSDVSWVGRLRGVSRRDGGDQPGCRRVVRVRHQRRRSGLHHAARRNRRHGPLSPAAPRHLSPVPGAHRAVLEPSRPGDRQRRGVRHVCERRLPVRPPLVRRRPLRLVRARLRCLARRQGSRRWCSRTGRASSARSAASTGERGTPRTSRQTKCCSSSCFRSVRMERTCFRVAAVGAVQRARAPRTSAFGAHIEEVRQEADSNRSEWFAALP